MLNRDVFWVIVKFLKLKDLVTLKIALLTRRNNDDHLLEIVGERINSYLERAREYLEHIYNYNFGKSRYLDLFEKYPNKPNKTHRKIEIVQKFGNLTTFYRTIICFYYEQNL